MLILGKTFDRSYNIRLPFLEGFYNIGIYFNKKTTFTLFSIDSDRMSNKSNNINMFKNLRSSKFCEVFINLHDFRKKTLDIKNQYESIKEDYKDDVNLFINETINLNQVNFGKKIFYDKMSIYGFTLNSFNNEFIFIISERHSIIKKLDKKIVRTTALQISSKEVISIVDDYHSKFVNSYTIKEPEEKETIKFN